MSYEGYTQALCAKGHLNEWDCNTTAWNVCKKCGDKIVWLNHVDLTNGSWKGKKRIDGYVKLKVKEHRTCTHCGTILESTYYIPGRKKR